jgi:non-lysosomal glucosylceramidase
MAPHRQAGKHESASDCCDSGRCDQLDRRQFVKLSAGLATGASLTSWAIAGPFDETDTVDHFVPVDKKLSPEWLGMLRQRGGRTWYDGENLNTIGMPIGGICAGQVYLTGDGRLVYWDVFNQNTNTGFGQANYKVGREPTEMVVKVSNFVESPDVGQGCAVRVEVDGVSSVRPLDATGFPKVRFCGEYPLAYVEYAADDFPVEVKLEACSPFIPLNAPDSTLPATILRYTLKNKTEKDVKATLAGWLQNSLLYYSAEQHAGEVVRTSVVTSKNGRAQLSLGLKTIARPKQPEREPIVLADFEGNDYGDWKMEGDAFGTGPASGTLPGQQEVSGFKGKGLVNTYLGGNDQKQGKLTSPEFTIERSYVSFLVGGGSSKETSMRLIVDGKPVRSASGTGNERLRAHNWRVDDLAGKKAHLEIVDAASDAWGHINIDQIEMRDSPMGDAITDVREQPDYGTMGLALLDGAGQLSSASLPAGDLPGSLFDDGQLATEGKTERPLDESLRGALGKTLELAPGQQADVTFVVTWCLPNMITRGQRVGNNYANRFRSAFAVADYVAGNLDRLVGDTQLWHDTYYDSTLPYWLLDRLHSTVGNLASATCQWWSDGRFWAWEGCGCCHGTCGHVWNYEHAMARLFPQLERSVREMQDFAPGVGLIEETGEIRFRGEGWGIWAGDSQGGYVLKAYREHQISKDGQFLKRNWPNIRKAVQFLLDQDGNADGMLEGKQHQTYDQDYYGANTMVGSLYLGALRAAEEMAYDVGDNEFGETCHAIFEAGRKNSVERLFNGEYFIQDVDLEQHPDWQYAQGCLADQLFGQGWAHQVGLGYVYPKNTVVKTLESIWKYCWAPDIKPQNDVHKPARWFAYPGEAGLLTCTWPISKHLGPKSTRYRNEVWTGIEYQVAGHMAYEGLVTEALAICRAIHERYHPSKHNPFNEIECGDHYARALASWGVLLGLAGFEYHGPKKHIGMTPRLNADDFRCVFSAAEGWGAISQQQVGGRQINMFDVKWGTLTVRTISLTAPDEKPIERVQVNRKTEGLKFQQKGRRITIELDADLVAKAGEQLRIELS